MSTWLAFAGIGVATDNLLIASVAAGFVASRLLKKWLLVTLQVLIIQLQGLILGWLVGKILDGWLGNSTHWVAIGFIMCMGLRIAIEAASAAQRHAQFALTTQNVLDSAIGTAIYTFVYGQSANMLHATLLRSLGLISATAALYNIAGLLLTKRYRIVWLVRLAGGLIVCVSAVFLFLGELGIAM